MYESPGRSYRLNASVKFHPFNPRDKYTLLEIKVKWIIFIDMKKLCKNCGNEKDITSFFKKKASPDGHQSVCKICTTIMTKEYKEKRKQEYVPVKKIKRDSRELNLVGATHSDYCIMYSAMSNLYPNKELDTHTQFCIKWGLKVSKSPRKGPKNQFTYEDCEE